MSKLAIDGGTPIRDNRIFYGRQWIDEDDIQAVEQVLRGDYLTCGPKVLELERVIENYTTAKHAVAVSNGTAALHCACLAAGIGPGDEVITSPLTFAASANCILYCGAKPVFADVNNRTYNIDPESVEKCVTEKTKAVIVVDYTGQVVDLQKIRHICDKHGLLLIEDAAHSFGSQYNRKSVGSIADMTCFSFHPVKTVTAGEGGAITTNNDELYRKLVLVHAHGITHDVTIMEDTPHEGDWCYEQVCLGYNYRITDFQSALLISQIKKIDKFKNRRKEIVRKYRAALQDIPELILQEEIAESDTCHHLFVIRLRLDRLRCTRREFYDAMRCENVVCQIHYIPVYWFPYYKKMGYKKGICPNAEQIYGSILSIPLYPAMTDDDVEDVINAINKVIDNYKI